MQKKKWIQSAIKRPGSLTKKAKSSGMTVAEYCQKKHSGTTARQCNLARTLSKLSRRKKK